MEEAEEYDEKEDWGRAAELREASPALVAGRGRDCDCPEEYVEVAAGSGGGVLDGTLYGLG